MAKDEDPFVKVLMSQIEQDANPYGDIHPDKILAGNFGAMGGPGGMAYGMYGSMFGSFAPQYSIGSPLKDFAPSNDPMLLALLGK